MANGTAGNSDLAAIAQLALQRQRGGTPYFGANDVSAPAYGPPDVTRITNDGAVMDDGTATTSPSMGQMGRVLMVHPEVTPPSPVSENQIEHQASQILGYTMPEIQTAAAQNPELRAQLAQNLRAQQDIQHQVAGLPPFHPLWLPHMAPVTGHGFWHGLGAFAGDVGKALAVVPANMPQGMNMRAAEYQSSRLAPLERQRALLAQQADELRTQMGLNAGEISGGLRFGEMAPYFAMRGSYYAGADARNLRGIYEQASKNLNASRTQDEWNSRLPEVQSLGHQLEGMDPTFRFAEPTMPKSFPGYPQRGSSGGKRWAVGTNGKPGLYTDDEIRRQHLQPITRQGGVGPTTGANLKNRIVARKAKIAQINQDKVMTPDQKEAAIGALQEENDNDQQVLDGAAGGSGATQAPPKGSIGAKYH